MNDAVWRSGHDYPEDTGTVKILYVIWGLLPTIRVGSFNADDGTWELEHETDEDGESVRLADAWVVAWCDVPDLPEWATDYVFRGFRQRQALKKAASIMRAEPGAKRERVG